MRTIILASTSPRRRELFSWLGVPFVAKESGFDEASILLGDFTDPQEYNATLAAGKALMIAPDFSDALVIGADTIVVVDTKILGKPKDLDDARLMLQTLRGRHHSVFTSLFVIDTLTGERNVKTIESTVEFFNFNDQAIEEYLNTSESLGKAGAYAIQGEAKKFVKSLEGSMSNVVGLPLQDTADFLEYFGVNIPVNTQVIAIERFGVSD